MTQINKLPRRGSIARNPCEPAAWEGAGREGSGRQPRLRASVRPSPIGIMESSTR